MFKKNLPKLVIVLLIGVLAACGSSNPYVDDAQSSIKDQNPQAALEAAEQSIQNFPNDPLGYYYKAVALGDIANTKEPSKREEFYTRMNEAFAKAQEMAQKMEDPPSQLQNIDAVKMAVWRTEHNRAIELATNDSLKQVTQNPLDKAVAHLDNATTIQPDSVLSWNVKAQLHYMNDNPEAAAQAKSKVLKLKEKPSPEDYTQLAAYYSLANKPKKALEVLEKGSSVYPSNKDIATRLADAYTSAGQTGKAISTLEDLIAQEPENPQFHLVLGTQLYKTVLTLTDSVSSNSDKIFELEQSLKEASGDKAAQIKKQISELKTENDKLQSRIDSLTQRATKELQTVLEYRPNDHVAYNTLGIIYQNKASALFTKRNQTEDNKMAAKYDKQAKEALRQAMQYYEKAAEIKPENKEYWRSLFSVYTALGMEEKAKEAMKKAGMQ